MKKIAISTNTSKNSKQLLTNNKQKEILPDWFNEDLQTSSLDSKEQEEMDELLSSI